MVSARRRNAELALHDLLTSYRQAQRFTPLQSIYLPSPDEIARDWEADLRRTFRVISMPEGAAEEALRREAHRIPPTREGRGARDAAIWLTVKEAHLTGSSVSRFVSENVVDFAMRDDRTKLRAELSSEFSEGSEQLLFSPSIDHLVSQLATPVEFDLDLDATMHEVAVAESVARGVIDELLSAALLKRRDQSPVVSHGLYLAEPPELSRFEATLKRAYDVSGRRFVLLGLRSNAKIRVGALTRITSGMAEALVSVALALNFRVWLELSSDNSRVLASEVTSMRGDVVESTSSELEFGLSR